MSECKCEKVNASVRDTLTGAYLDSSYYVCIDSDITSCAVLAIGEVSPLTDYFSFSNTISHFLSGVSVERRVPVYVDLGIPLGKTVYNRYNLLYFEDGKVNLYSLKPVDFKSIIPTARKLLAAASFLFVQQNK